MLVFAQEQQGCWQWGLDLGTLMEPDPIVLSDFESRWQSDECRLGAFLQFASQLARVVFPPVGRSVITERELPAPGWTEIMSPLKSLSLEPGSFFTNGRAVFCTLDGSLGAVDVAAVRVAADQLGVTEQFAIALDSGDFIDSR
ncbi:MAG: hypothetical protein Q8S33_31860 [Myxococcales bacterium]|nr:hypothetical protein [Myxococcales bacterium]